MARTDRKLTKAEREALATYVPNEDPGAATAALERELAGYDMRLKAVKSGRALPEHADDNAENVGERIKAVRAELARVKKSGVTNRVAALDTVLQAQAEETAAAGPAADLDEDVE